MYCGVSLPSVLVSFFLLSREALPQLSSYQSVAFLPDILHRQRGSTMGILLLFPPAADEGSK